MGSTLDAKNLQNGNEPVWVHVPVWSMKQQVMIGQLVSQVFFSPIFFRVGKQGNIFYTMFRVGQQVFRLGRCL